MQLLMSLINSVLIYLLPEGSGPFIEASFFLLTTSFLLTQILHYSTHYIGLLSYMIFLFTDILLWLTKA